MPSTIPYTIAIRKRGTSPPLFLAGTFTHTHWKLQEMDYTRGDDGEYTFTKSIDVVPNEEYHFKFKAGEQGPWFLDKDQAVVTASDGTTDNLLKAPSEPQTLTSAKLNKGLGLAGSDERSFTPIEIVAQTAAEVADTAEILDKESENSPPDYTWNKEPPARVALFPHENLGAYEFTVDDPLNPGESNESSSPRSSRKASKDYSLEGLDINDPTLVKFPSDRSSVMDTLRKIQSSVADDAIGIETNVSHARRDSTDDSAITVGSMSPRSPSIFEKRESRLSHSSFGHSRSAVSLTAIAEEPRGGSSANPSHPRTSQVHPDEALSFSETPPSDEEHAVMMKQEKVIPNPKHDENKKFSEQEDEHITEF